MMRARRLALTVLGVLAVGLVFSSVPAPALTIHASSGSFGSATSTPADPAPLSAPSGVAVNDATEDVYVVDKGNKRVEEFNAGGTFLKEFAPTGGFSNPEAIAIDNSGSASDPSKEYVYITDVGNNVIDKFSASGAYLGQIATGEGGAAFSGLDGVAVDAEGKVWVYQESKEIDDYSDALVNTFLPPSRESHAEAAVEPGFAFAVDSEDNLYVVHRGRRVVAKLNSAGNVLEGVEELGGEGPKTGIAVDLANNDVYLNNGSSVSWFAAIGSPIEEFGSAQLTSSGGSGIAVNSANGTVYVADSVANVVDIFALVVLPDVTTGTPATTATASSLTLTGTVNPLDTEDASYYFQYGETTTYGSYAPAPPGTPVSGSEPIPASTTITGLTIPPNTTYNYRLDATNKSGLIDYGQDQAVTYAVTPAVDDQPAEVTDVGRAGAVFQGTVNPENSDTFYHFAYIPAGEYQPGASNPYAGGGATADVNAGAGLGDETVGPVPAGDLLPGTTYHYALVAGNTAGSSIGEYHTFTTTPGTPPVATTGGASAISQNEATLSGTVGTNGLQTSYGFEIGTEAGNYGPATGLGSLGGAVTETVSLTLSKLQPGRTYHYRVTASNADGTSQGEPPGTFTTPGFPALLTPLSPPPLIATPAIAFPAEAKTTTTTPKVLTNAQKLAAALKACKKEPKTKRASCQKQARQRYGPVKQKSKQK
jgi:DNA-binding beta-propeller fold protein YncE